MSKQANKTLIGGFVVGATVIVMIGILIFGSGRLLAEKENYVLFFDGSVKGLTIGAPVRLKGVAVGQVANMKLLMDQTTTTIYNEVIIEVVPGKINSIGQDGTEVPMPRQGDKSGVKMLMDAGLRAKLDMTSFVTGQLYIAFDFYPDSEVIIRGFKTDHQELPTLPSDLKHLADQLKQIPFADLVEQTLAAVQGINQLVRSPEIKEALVTLNQTMQDAGELARKLDGQVAPLALELTGSVRDTRQLVNNLNHKVPAVADEIIAAMKSTAALVEKTNASAIEIYNLVEENSAFRYNLNETLSELSAASRSIRLLADYLEQHPEALLYGKPGGK